MMLKVVTFVVGVGVGALIGGLLGHFLTKPLTEEQQLVIDTYAQYLQDEWQRGAADGTNDRILDGISTDNLEAYLRELSAEPHLAGTERDHFLAQYIRDHFQDVGFDSAELVPSSFLLSRPNATNPNVITITDGAGDVVFTSSHREEFVSNETDFVDAFLAFTPAGDVSAAGGGVVYVNYGTEEDFQRLATLNVSVSGNIAVMRYGSIYRGNKIENAQRYGAVGAILFSDPADVAVEGSDNVFPDSWWLPGSGVQRGSAFLGDGDPLTPGWPSTAYAHRINVSDAGLLTIPAQPVGYSDAFQILRRLGGDAAPASWQGGLELPYNLGPTFLPEFEGETLRLTTHNYEASFLSYNVFGAITGAVEPDRYVLIGNHRDAWGYGASDPSSGTAQLLETARVLGQLVQEGWRPRRTLVFCSWGAEEYGLIGSTEWVEEHVARLQTRAVAYVNTDTCSTGPVLEAPASPLLWDAIINVTKLVPGVQNATGTVHDEWVQHYGTTDVPMYTLGSGSDYAPFFIYAGVPAADVWFRRDKTVHNISMYPSYHTGYETFEMVTRYNDPGLRYGQGCGRVAALLLKALCDSAVLPFGLRRFPQAMQQSLEAFQESGVKATVMEFYPGYEHLEEAVQNLTAAAVQFEETLAGMEWDPYTLRRANDQLMSFEQSFLIPEGLPGRPLTRHAVFAPSQFDNYASSAFPGLTDLMYDYDEVSQAGEDALAARQEAVRRHVSLLTILTQRAAGQLADVTKFG